MKALRILSHKGNRPLFVNRAQTGQLLAQELGAYRGRHALILGIPRGGVIVAKEMAIALQGDLDIVLTHKLGAPGNPELAMGAITEQGELFLDPSFSRGLEPGVVQQEQARQYKTLLQRARLYREVLPKVPCKDRTVILTDDGVARGFTLHAAISAVRQEHPEKLILALPVGPVETVRALAQEADETVCLWTPPSFYGVAQFYQSFDPVEDAEVLSALKTSIS